MINSDMKSGWGTEVRDSIFSIRAMKAHGCSEDWPCAFCDFKY